LKKDKIYKTDICIVGLGPSGLGAALKFSDSNLASKVLCIDAGSSENQRSCSVLENDECNRLNKCAVISGFGGASLLGGKKIGGYPAGSKLSEILGSEEKTQKKLEEALTYLNKYFTLEKFKIESEDIKLAKEFFGSLGFNYKYYDVYLNTHGDFYKVYQKLKSSGMQILLKTELIDIDPENSNFKLTLKQAETVTTILAKILIIGVGRVGRHLLVNLNPKLGLRGIRNHIDVGVRLEFPTDYFSSVYRYHGDLKLKFKDARTFCFCKDGKVAVYLMDGIFFTDGYIDLNKKSGFTNIGIQIRLDPLRQKEPLLKKIEKKMMSISNGLPVRQRLTDYLRVKIPNIDENLNLESSISFWRKGDINQCFPEVASKRIRNATHYFASKLLPENRWVNTCVFAPEFNYGGLMFPIKSDFSAIPKLYLVGDCIGKFRGILQAFCSGTICAESIIGENL
jgi:uncharacterized FAD-dependent dehydrogenase